MIFNLPVIDGLADHQDVVTEYKNGYKNFQSIKRELVKLEEEFAKEQRDKDYNQFQFDELNEAEMVQGEQELIESKLNRLQHAERVADAISFLKQGFNDETGPEQLLRALTSES